MEIMQGKVAMYLHVFFYLLGIVRVLCTLFFCILYERVYTYINIVEIVVYVYSVYTYSMYKV